MEYKPTIGLEVHVQLKTDSKLFCGCSTEFGAPANDNICPRCTGQPGVLPVLNKKAVELTVKTGLALNCKIQPNSIFARKQYFYPDLPKNYQVSQYELPLATDGHLNIETKTIRIHRIHLEEDAGKLLHAIGSRELDYSLVDFNRTGIPLMEIVSEPDMHSADEAYGYVTELKKLLEFIGVSDCDMEKGTLRCDANISVAPIDADKLGTKAEIKNMNSFKALKLALTYEIERQISVLNSGGKIVQETRSWDSQREITESMRSKEEAHDYRYFPEPDLVPMELDDNFVNQIKITVTDLPQLRKERYIKDYNLSDYDAQVLTSSRELGNYFETVLKEVGELSSDLPKTVCNWITTELLGRLNSKNLSISDSPVKEKQLADLVNEIRKGTISGKIAKTVFEEMFNTGHPVTQIIQEKGLVQISDQSEIEKIVEESISENPKAVAEYKAGKEKAAGAIVGTVMKKSQGRANPQIVNQIIRTKLK